MKKNKIYIILSFFAVSLAACNPSPSLDDKTMLDSGQISYAVPDSLNKHLLSAYLPNPTPTQLNTPVIICAHGYTATTFEWDEFRTYAKGKGTFYVSQVLLGGHGRSYPEFKKSSWENWQSSITEEYQQLSKIGYKKIYLAGSSTGAPLIINMIKKNFFKPDSLPKGIFLVDPIIVSSNKTLTLVGLLGPVLGYLSVDLSNGEKGHWYVYRPQETLKELMALIDLTRIDLEKGISLPTGTTMKVYKSEKDETADPISAFMIYKGMRTSTGGNIDVEMESSNLHVFTRLEGRDNITADQRALQQKVFADMESRMLK
jgi:carboxylesterase